MSLLALKFIAAGVVVVALLFVGLAIEEALKYQSESDEGVKMKVYVAGRMRGIQDLNRPAFAAATLKLRQQGHDVYNPAAANLEGMPLNRIMAHVLAQLCECDAVAMLPGWWTRFGGAWVEWLLARYLKLKIIYL